MKRKIKNKCYYVTAMFTREHAGWPRTIQNSCFVHLTAMERKTYIVLKLSFFRNNLRTEQGCLALARCQEMFHQLSQPKYSLFRTQFPSATTTRCTLLLLTRSHCSESAAGHKLCQHHYTWKGKLQKKKILNELLWVPLHFHQYKQVATVNEFLYWNNNSKTLCLKNTAYLPTKQQSYFTELIFRIHCVRSLMVCYIFPHFKYLEN